MAIKFSRVVVFSIILLSIAWFIMFFAHPAYKSLQLNCYATQEKQEEESAGTFDSKTGEIDVKVPSKTILKHELVHKKQLSRNMLFSCKNPHLNYINELNAYISASLPNEIFISIYQPDDSAKELLRS